MRHVTAVSALFEPPIRGHRGVCHPRLFLAIRFAECRAGALGLLRSLKPGLGLSWRQGLWRGE